ncbi:hypothetical protein [Shewanella maritima]|uniref:hypothetical protein n=1 Tax=Shewanella maritima TaxID=2520507 RepID=UPI003736C132
MKSADNEWKQQQCVNTKRLARWTFAWVVSLAVAVFGPEFIWQDPSMTLSAILINFAVGLVMIIANKKHLTGLDELQQRIQLNAMGLSLGIGLVAGISYSTLDTTGIINSHAEISHLVILMSLTYMSGILLGNRKYQ